MIPILIFDLEIEDLRQAILARITSNTPAARRT